MTGSPQTKVTVPKPSIHFGFFFAWYDIWIGFYWSKASRTLYVCPLPMIGFKFQFIDKTNTRDIYYIDIESAEKALARMLNNRPRS